MATDPFGFSDGGEQQSDESPATSAYDWIYGFGKSALEGIPELVGVTPSTETLQYRQDNPVGGFASQLAGFAVPYAGWMKAVGTTTKLARAAEAVGSMSKSPFLQGALRTGTALAPFEAGRLGVSQLVGDKPFDEMLGDTMMSLAFNSGIGGLFHGIASGGTRDPSLATLFPGLDLAAPLPLQARTMRSIIEGGKLPPEQVGRANAKLADVLRLARTEELPESQKYVADIAHDAVPGSDPSGLQQQLNRLFRVKEDPTERTLQIRKFAVGKDKDFPDPTSWNDAARAGNLPEGFEEHGQYFRSISFKNAPGATKETLAGSQRVATQIDNKLTRNMLKVDDNTFMTREADDGMFVIARKTAGDIGVGDPADKWVLFKTDKPGMFLPDAERWAKSQVAVGSWTPGANLAADGGPVYNAAKNFMAQFPLRNYMAMAGTPSGLAKAVGSILPSGLQGAQAELVARAGEAFKEYVAPRMYQFRKSFRANYIVNTIAKAAYDEAEDLTQEIVNGSVKVDPGKNLIRMGLKDDKSPSYGFTPVREMVNSIPEDQFQQEFHQLWRNQTPSSAFPDLVAKGKLSPEVSQLATELEKIDQWSHNNVSKSELAVGQQPEVWKPGKFGLPRSWEGDTRVVVKNDAGEIVALTGGANRRAAQSAAEKLIGENPGWRVEGEYSLSQQQSALDPYVKSPTFTLENQGVRGFKYDTEPFTRDDFIKEFENALRNKNKYQANISINDLMSPQMLQLEREDPAAYRMAKARLLDYAGVQSQFSRMQNRVADQLLGPVLGPNSASKIVQIANTAMFNWQLGALKLAYPLVNAIQGIQTVAPEIAFVLGKAVPESLAGDYSHFAAGGTKGPVGGMAVLSPIKMMYKSLREMASPSAPLSEAFERAVNERVIDPRLVEEYIGASRTKVGQLGKVLKGEEPVWGWLRALSEYLPAQTERLSRTQAFTTGYIMARDYLKREGQALNTDQIYQFAKQFTEKTMFLYSVADKPRIFTTPAGSMMGLFKNWMFHYLGAMGEYTQEGFLRNNWAPLLWQTAGTAALGGLAAMPLSSAADAFSRLWTKKGLLENAYEQFGDSADGIYFGLPAALAGVSLYSQVDSTASNPIRDASSLFSVAAWDRVKQLGKLAGGAMDEWQTTGEHPGRTEDVRNALIRTFAPTSVYRTMATLTPGQITQLGTGYPLLKDVSPMHKFFYSVGFNPTELDRGNAIAQELYEHKEKLNAQVKKLSTNWAEAEMARDTGRMSTIMRQAMVWGVDVSSVIKGGMKDLENMRQDVVERHLKPRDIAGWRAVVAKQREQANENE